MRHIAIPSVALFLFALGANAQAYAGTCIDPHSSYEAHAVGGHDVIIHSTIGKRRAPLQLTTTCINLEKSDVVSVGSSFGCVGVGDTVVATKIDGHREVCNISRVAPYSPPNASSQP